MRLVKNHTGSFYCSERAVQTVTGFCRLTDEHPYVLEPFRGEDILAGRSGIAFTQIPGEDVQLKFERTPVAAINNFLLFPTVERTTLMYDRDTDLFIKVLHPLTVKSRLLAFVSDRGKHLHDITEMLLSSAIPVPEIAAYGTTAAGMKTVLVMERIKGDSLDSLLIKKRMVLPADIYQKVIEKIAGLHKLGYWFGDLRPAHIFIWQSDISGFVDIDSIRKNLPFRLKNLAKDIAGLNHPGLPLTADEKKELLHYYTEKLNIGDEQEFVDLVKHYTERRWGGKTCYELRNKKSE